MSKFSYILRRKRRERGWTQAYLGELVNVSATTVRSWETGRRSPGLESQRRLSEIFEVSAQEFAFDEIADEIFNENAEDRDVLIVQEPLARVTFVGKDRNRQRLLRRVWSLWVEGVLETSLYQSMVVLLGMRERPDAVHNPWSLVVQEADLPARELPRGTHITSLYTEFDGALLILGEPGSGKTTLLLQLLRDLVEQACVDESQPIPVLFNLSSWAQKQLPLENWIVEEFSVKYQVPRALAQLLIDGDKCTLLLDGLDEVDESVRDRCIVAINRYRIDHGMVPIVVCSRREDYFAQQSRVALRTAVVVEPLTVEQLNAYVNMGGLTVMREALDNDAVLREMASSPLMLNVMALVYATGGVALQGTFEEQQREIFHQYVLRVLKRGKSSIYTIEQTLGWLGWLASQMKFSSQSEFYVERLSPSWLSDDERRRYRNLVNRSLSGFNFMIIAGIAAWLRGGKIGVYSGVGEGLLGLFGAGPGNQVLGWMSPGLNAGFAGAGTYVLIFGITINLSYMFTLATAPDAEEWSLRRVISMVLVGLRDGLLSALFITLVTLSLFGLNGGWREGLLYGIAFGVVSGLMTGLQNGFTSGFIRKKYAPGFLVRLSDGFVGFLFAFIGFFFVDWIIVGAVQGLEYGLIVALFIGLLFALNGTLTQESEFYIRTAEYVRWSWYGVERGLQRNVVRAVMMSCIVALSVGSVVGVSGGIFHGIEYGLRFGLVYGPLVGLIIGMVGLLFGAVSEGWQSDQLEEHQLLLPNRGIHLSGRNGFFAAMLLGGVGGVLSGLISGVIYGSIAHLSGWFILGMGYAIAFGMNFFVFFLFNQGGTAFVEHYLLRWELWRKGVFPLNCVRFLDYASQHILLRRVGGGYIFIHRLLLEYFASLDVQKSKKGENK